MSGAILRTLRTMRDAGRHRGITSMCSAHPLVIEATLRHAHGRDADALIEATCNQVNQEGGYTGLTPADFGRLVFTTADRIGFDPGRVILGGDHLGPNPWKQLPAEAAMARAEAMIAAYVEAGFQKLHLDASMGCLGEPAALGDDLTASRAARLARVAERSAARAGRPMPVYVIGTEVPVPGGAHEAIDGLDVTRPAAAIDSVEANRRAFAAEGLAAAFERVIALVVQPGVEFGNENVVVYDRPTARDLTAALAAMPGLVFEAHSTDYQPRRALRGLVEDGCAILKVGPGATFALREALYGLAAIAAELDGVPASGGLRAVLERAMLARPDHWRGYYHGTPDIQHRQRHFSYSDRIRYYWPQTEVADEVARLTSQLANRVLPPALIRQYLGLVADDIAAGQIPATPQGILIGSIGRVLDDYAAACGP